MQDAGNQNSSGRLAVKDNVSAVLHSPKSGTKHHQSPGPTPVIGKHLTVRVKIIDVTDGLVRPTGAKSICADVE
jgi:hypothetical protein